jgi:hypothetical protein
VTAKKLSPTVPAFPAKIGERLQAVIVFLVNPNDFFIQPVAIYSKMEEMTGAVTKEFDSGVAPLSEVSEGDFCWAKYPQDSVWYRARVSQVFALALQHLNRANLLGAR